MITQSKFVIVDTGSEREVQQFVTGVAGHFKMSSSVFKVYPSSSSCPEEDSLNEDAEGETAASVDEHLKIDSNLVIVVGKDGSVHVDQKTLHSLLGKSKSIHVHQYCYESVEKYATATMILV